ncbi:nucleotidyltransferase family protein [Thermodesulfomicrobium sp. WS]|uniref:putative nucleotidyltransferase substrate binding domain-containing protein n=1 Tax=Thermodesulfomicrobium sp. WS TaxID=3004129 RepID=UPI0024901A4F|nr:putative nucleotidyltransferase substrate binding domain-containing protein [Thermodesulfomicrobium sp. WS]BDV01917.1 nucleotidyltransferase family protein [Thermodesulfomicrobium sp. WS]
MRPSDPQSPITTFLRQTLPFSDLPAEAIVHLARQATVDFFPQGTRIFTRGKSEISHLLVIQKGAIKLFVEENGATRLVDIRSEGASVGAVCLFHGTHATMDAEALEDTFVVAIPRGVFLETMARHPELTQFYLKTLAQGALDRAFEDIRHRPAVGGSETTLPLFTQKLVDLIHRPPVTVPLGTTIQTAAREMLRHGTGSLLFREPSGGICGIITDTDLRKALAFGMDSQAPAETIMSTPVRTLPHSATCFDALTTMMAESIHHLAVERDGEILGVISSHDLLVVQGRSPLALFQDIASQGTFEGLYPIHGRIPAVVRTLIREGAKAGHITRLIAILNDQIVIRLLELLTAEIGPSPVPYVWILMGSEGRQEQTFSTDQDNALISADVSEDFVARAGEVYFQALTSRMEGHLLRCGIPRCPAQMMAVNPQWRGSLGHWKERVDRWRTSPEPTEVLHSSIFFDFRPLFGRMHLGTELRDHITTSCAGQTVFLRYLAAEAVRARPPLTFFKGFVVEKDGQHKNSLDIKTRGLLPFLDFARVMALYHGIPETGTLGRLDALHAGGHISRDLHSEAREAFEFLLHLRLARQLEQVEAGQQPHNYIDPSTLTALEKRTLREAFGLVSALHEVLRDTFHLRF